MAMGTLRSGIALKITSDGWWESLYGDRASSRHASIPLRVSRTEGRTAEVLNRSSLDIFLKLFFDFRRFLSWSSSFGVFLETPS